MRNVLRSDSHVFLSTKLATRREFHLAWASVLVSILLFLIAAPFAKWSLGQVGAFIPAYEAALVVSDLVTAALLFGQFSVLRSRALLVLSGGYLFTALIAFAHAITFPGALSAAGLLGGGSQTTAWLYMFWHGGFPLFVILYTGLKNDGRDAAVTLATSGGRGAQSDLTVVIGLTMTLAAVIGAIYLSTRSTNNLPTIILNNHFTSAMTAVVLTLCGVSFLALIFLCCRTPYTVLDLWLIVVLSAWLSDIGLSAVVNGGRFDFGWYAGRIYGLLSANFLLVVLLLEGGKQYTRLARMESRYRGLLEAAPDVMVVVNEKGEIVLLNVRTEEQFGYSREELIGQKVQSIIPEGFAERLIADGRRSAAEALAQQIGTGIELYGRRKDGTEFPIEIMLSPLESAEGILITAAVRDISVRRNAEEHLAQMESRYRGLLEAAPDAMVVVNQHGGIVLLNLRAEAQFGYSRDELVGQPVGRIIPEGFAERLLADGRRSAAEALAQQIGTGIELYGRRKDSTEFPIEIMLSPLESAEGILITAAVRDISVRRNAEEHLAQMESRYRGLLEAAPDAMVVINQDGRIVLLNLRAEAQFGYSRNELVGQRVGRIIPEGFAERLLADGLRSADEALAQQIGTGIELYGRRRNGSEFPIEIMLSPLESTEGILVTAAIRDITARKSAETQLLQKIAELNRSNEELEQFAYVASHDLQEPLRMVASYTQLLSRRYGGKLDSDADEFIAFAVDGASRMQKLIQDLLAYSRVGTKGKELLDTSSNDALAQALMNLRGAIEQSGAQVTHDSLPVVLADQMQLIQLFQNLVGNAIKYQNCGTPLVHISAVKNGARQWLFSVQDNGMGIDPKYFDRIFGMFQRLHKRDEFAGTGIGLAICKKIVERHGGSIWVDSQPEQGSTFRFALAEGETGA